MYKKILGLIWMIVMLSFSVNALTIDNCVAEDNIMKSTGTNKLSCDFNFDGTEESTNQYYIVNTYDAPGSFFTEQSRVGELISDFAYVDFHRGIMNDNTEVEVNLIDSSNDYANFDYDFVSGITNDYFAIQFRTDFGTTGKNYYDVGEYDGITYDIGVTTADSVKVKMRLYSKNLSDSSTETTCDTPYYDVGSEGSIQLSTSFEEYYIPFSAVQNDCSDFDYENIYKNSLIFNDITSSEASGKVRLRDIYLNKEIMYILDNFDYVQEFSSGNFNETNWELLSEDVGWDVESIDITDLHNLFTTNSLQIHINPSTSSTNWANIGLEFPIVQDFNSIKAVKMKVQQDDSETDDDFEMKIRLIDSANDYCESDNNVKRSITQDVVNDFTFNISDFTTNCNLSDIEKFAFQLADDGILNISQDYDIYIDDIILKKYNETTTVSSVFRKDSLTNYNGMDFQFKGFQDFTTTSSPYTNFNVSTTYSLGTGTPITSYSGDLEDWINETMNVSDYADEVYVLPTQTDISNFKTAMSYIRADDLTNARIYASNVNYEVVEWTDTDVSEYYVFREVGANKGWGTYIFNPTATYNISIINVHPIEDDNSNIMAIREFKELGAEDLFIATAHRSDSLNYMAEFGEYFNIYHPLYNGFVEVYDSNNIYLEQHGWEYALHNVNYPDTIISEGKGVVSKYLNNINKTMNDKITIDSEIYTATPCNDIFTDSYCLTTLNYSDADNNYLSDLKNRYSQLGEYVRDQSGDFISLETSEDVRFDNTKLNTYVDALVLALNDETAPVVTNLNIVNNEINQTETTAITVDITDAVFIDNAKITIESTEYDLTYVSGNQYIYTFSGVGKTLGAYTIENVYAIDNNSNIVNQVFSSDITVIDEADPVLSNFEISNTSFFPDSTEIINITATDNNFISKVYSVIEGDSYQMFASGGKYFLNIGDFAFAVGNHTITEIWATDISGNNASINPAQTFEVKSYPYTPPTVDNFTISDSSFVRDETSYMTIDISDEDGVDIGEITAHFVDTYGEDKEVSGWNLKENNTYEKTFTLSSGIYNLTYIHVEDLEGAETDFYIGQQVVVTVEPRTDDVGDDNEDTGDTTGGALGGGGGGFSGDTVEIIEVNGTLEINPKFVDVLHVITEFGSEDVIWQHVLTTNREIDECVVDDGFMCEIDLNKAIITKDYTNLNSPLFTENTQVRIISNELVGEMELTVRNINIASKLNIFNFGVPLLGIIVLIIGGVWYYIRS